MVVLASRVALLPTAPTEWDSVQLALGVTNFDIRVHSPHPPGYWLYIALGRLVDAITALDPSRSLTLISAITSAAAAVAAWRLALRLGSRWFAAVFVLLIATNPFVWFYGLTANVYVFDLLCALVLLNFALRPSVGRKEVLTIAFTLALMAGVRQSVVYIFGPLALYVIVRARPSLKTLLMAIAAGVVTVLAWLIPASIDQPGGLHVLYQSTESMWHGAAAHSSLLDGASSAEVKENVGKATTTPIIASFFAIAAGVVVWLLTLITRKHHQHDLASPPARQTAIALALLAIPSILVTTLGHFGKVGYILAYMPAVLLACSLGVRRLPRRLNTLGLLAFSAVAVVWGAQFTTSEGLLPQKLVNRGPWFFDEQYGVPFKTNTLATIDLYNRDTAQYMALPEVVGPNDTLIYYGGEGVERFRKMSYEFPDLIHELVQEDPTVACTVAYKGRLTDCHTDPIRAYKVRPGGRALFVANAPNDDVKRLADAGRAVRLGLSTGPTVFAVAPGEIVNGQPVLVDPTLVEELKSNYT